MKLRTILAYSGAASVVAILYAGIFWGIPLAAFNNQLAISRPESMGMSFWRFVCVEHLLAGVLAWGAWSINYLLNSLSREKL